MKQTNSTELLGDSFNHVRNKNDPHKPPRPHIHIFPGFPRFSIGRRLFVGLHMEEFLKKGVSEQIHSGKSNNPGLPRIPKQPRYQASAFCVGNCCRPEKNNFLQQIKDIPGKIQIWDPGGSGGSFLL